jgi:hypothetical protein
MKMRNVFRGGAGLLVVGAMIGLGSVPAVADSDGNEGIHAKPFTFVGAAGDCGTGYPAGSRIVTARWLAGMGLPDNSGPNVGTDPTDNPNKRDRHSGLLLSKNGTTPDCSSAGAEIKQVKGMTVTATFALGFDYRNGGHCGAGAPRFNVVVTPPSGPDTSHFVGGCANDSAPTPAPQDPTQWTRVRFETSNPAESFPTIPVGSKIKSISLIYDEGTDTANNDTQGVGLAVVDNIFINGALITGQGDDD